MRLTEARVERLQRYLESQIPCAEEALTNRVARFREYIERYEAKTVEKDWPWRGSSSVHPPVVAIVVDAVKARLANALFAQDQIVSVEALTDDPIMAAGQAVMDPQTGEPLTWREIAQQAERYLNYEISPAGEVDFIGFAESLLNEILLLGTAFPRVYWKVEQLTDFNEADEPVKHIAFDNVVLDVVPTEQVLVPRGYSDLKRIPWISYRYPMRPSEVLQRIETSGWNKSAVKAFLDRQDPMPISELVEAQELSESGTSGTDYETDERELMQTWLRFDWDGKGYEARIVVDHSAQAPYHIFSVKPWPNDNGQMDFVEVARYLRRRQYLYGMGIPERLESLDEAYATTTNQMIDNVTIANTRVWSVNQHSVEGREFDRMYPGMKVYRGDDARDIQPLQMGEVYPSIFEQLNVLQGLIEKTAKLTEYQLGREASSVNGQLSATSTLALIQQGDQFHDSSSRDFRYVINLCGQQWLDLLAQHKPLERVRQVLGPRAEPFLAALTLPGRDLRKRLAFRISFSTAASTRELARQEQIAKWQTRKQYYADLLGMAQLRLQLPQVGPLTDMIAQDGRRAFLELLEQFGENITGNSLPNWMEWVEFAQQAEQLAGPPQQIPGPGAATGVPEMIGGGGVQG